MASRSWNRVELIGNLTRDPELRYTPNGAAVATFSIATNRSYTVDGERKEDVDFHRCVAWNKLAELCSQLLKKGVKVFVSGRLQNRSWEGQDGQQRNMTEIVIEDMLVLTAKGGEGDYVPSAAAEMAEEPVPARQMDEMPKAPKEDSKPKADKPAKEEVEDLDDLPF
jgi:single-strand DNA-binding protein